MNSIKAKLSVALSAALGAGAAPAMDNPFAMQVLPQGYQLSNQDIKLAAGQCGGNVGAQGSGKSEDAKCGGKTAPGKQPEAKCGEGQCGANMMAPTDSKAMEAKCGEGQCGANMMAPTDSKAMEAKCGEGQCGSNMKATQ